MKFKRRPKHPLLKEVLTDIVGFLMIAILVFLAISIL